MRRILVAGSSASGKTTLARVLADRLDLPYVDMDALYHGPNWQPRPEFRADVERFAGTDAWIADSHGYASVRDLLWSRADAVIWLDYPRWLVMSRLIRRTWRRQRRREVLFNGNQEPPLWTVFTDREHLIRWAWSDYRRRRADLLRRRSAPEYAHLAFTRLRHPRETERWLDGVRPAENG